MPDSARLVLRSGYRHWHRGKSLANRTIASLAAMVRLDASQLKAGAVVTRKELGTVNKLFRDTRTPAEQFGLAVDQLKGLLSKGAISQDLYNRSLNKMQRELRETTGAQHRTTEAVKDHNEATRLARFMQEGNAEVIGTFRNRLSLLHPALLAIAAATAAWAIALRAVRSVVTAVVSQFEEIDKLAKSARKLGIAVAELQAIRDLAGEASSLSADAVDKSLQGMVRRVAEAARGTGEARAVLQELGLDAKELNLQGPFQQFQAIADAIANVRSEQDRLLFTQKLFESEGVALVNTLTLGSAALDEAKEKSAALRGVLSDFDTAAVERANDSVGGILRTP